ncbi:hypothetical protein HYH96_02445 [Clostridium botulinum]|uniref:hypothetical protein n=1 Tax=Clostridium botulinum TaxID=1491 RepID=UPI001748B64C|nr:hypothetical protein [Clostridium botulinum]MBD5642755.1 hypothetical protein [Clostridium botulinum]
MGNKSSFNKVIEYKKYKEIYDFTTLEVKISIISSITITILAIYIINQANIDNINELMREITKSLSFSLIGYLGFVVSGLAILTSAISNKFINILRNRKKVNIIERILLSFYLLGIVVGSVIIISLVLYLCTYLNMPCNYKIITVIILPYSYLLVFTIIYSIALIGNCIEIFKLVNIVDDYEIDGEVSDMNEDRYLYTSFRITALEKVVFDDESSKSIEKIQEYYETMNRLIEEGCKNEIQKESLKRMLKKKFGI